MLHLKGYVGTDVQIEQETLHICPTDTLFAKISSRVGAEAGAYRPIPVVYLCTGSKYACETHLCRMQKLIKRKWQENWFAGNSESDPGDVPVTSDPALQIEKNKKQ